MPARKPAQALSASFEGSGTDCRPARGSAGGARALKGLCLLSLVACLMQCGCSPAATPTMQLEMLTPISECFPYYHVLVWNDLNGDGVQDPGEGPLAGVPVSLRRAGHPDQSFPGQTGPDGIADLHGIGDFGSHCDEIEIEVVVPEGFMYTSPTPAPADLVGLPPGSMLKFGLMPVKGSATP